MDRKFDQWRFITILTSIKTYDIMVEERQDALDIMTAVNAAISKLNQYDFQKRLLQRQKQFNKENKNDEGKILTI